MKFVLLHHLRDLEINAVVLIRLISNDEKNQTHDNGCLFLAQTAA